MLRGTSCGTLCTRNIESTPSSTLFKVERRGLVISKFRFRGLIDMAVSRLQNPLLQILWILALARASEFTNQSTHVWVLCLEFSLWQVIQSDVQKNPCNSGCKCALQISKTFLSCGQPLFKFSYSSTSSCSQPCPGTKERWLGKINVSWSAPEHC